MQAGGATYNRRDDDIRRRPRTIMFNFFRKAAQPAEAVEAGVHDGLRSAPLLKLFVESFPIGRKIKYTPEFKRDVVFPTIVIGYRLNDKFLYINDDVMLDESGTPMAFRTEAGTVRADALEKFELLLPDTSDLEKQLDYFTRAELGRDGQFRKGNSVTLFVDTDERGIPTVDTRVVRRQTMANGPFAGSATLLVAVDLTTLVMADKRKRHRVEAAIPAILSWGIEQPSFQGVLQDFSERWLRVGVPEPGATMPSLAEGEEVGVQVDAGTGAPVFVRGVVFRRADAYLVVEYQQILKYGKFDKIGLMDVMEIKTALLNRRG